MNFTATQFAEEIGVQKSGISHILSGRNNPSLDFVQKILQRFPEVNMEWLVLGKGSMINSDSGGINRPDLPVSASRQSQNQPLDLFSPQISQPSEVEPLAFKPEQKDTVREEKSPFMENAKQPVIERLKEEQTMPYGENKKRIQKIIVFYSDRTFAEYNQSD